MGIYTWRYMTLYRYCCSVAQLCLTLCDPMDCMQHIRIPYPSPSPRACSNLCPLNPWCHPTILCPLLLLPSVFPSIRVFSNELVLRIRWPKYWSFSFLPMSIQDWFPLGCTIGSPCWPGDSQESPPTPQLKSINFRHSAFFIDQLAHPYMTTGKTIALTRWTFVGKVMSLLFNMLSRLVIAFLPRSKHLLISWLQTLYALILEPQKYSRSWINALSWLRTRIRFPIFIKATCHFL